MESDEQTVPVTSDNVFAMALGLYGEDPRTMNPDQLNAVLKLVELALIAFNAETHRALHNVVEAPGPFGGGFGQAH